MARKRYISIGTDFIKVTCQKCGNEVTRRQSKAINPMLDGAITGYTEPNKEGHRREITRKGRSPRVHRWKCI